jgi:predicted Zn finger-like uncharacterized protein
MILTCPNCSARFLINAAALHPSGREVRCGRCRHQWFAAPPEPEKPRAEAASAEPPTGLTPPPLPPEAPGMRAAVEPRPIPPGSNLPVIAKPRRRAYGAVLGWAALVLAVIALGVAIAERDSLMAMYPDVRPVYAAVGFEVPGAGDGLQIADVTSSRVMQEGLPVLICEGRINNVSNYERRVPTLRGALRDSGGRELQSWTFTVPSETLAPGAAIPFRTEVRQPATSATELSITFVANNP